MKLENKVAVITGGNSGIGLATAKLFAAEGAKVTITGRNQGTIDLAINDIGRGAQGLVSDSGSPNSYSELYKAVASNFGKIDVLVINAGVYHVGPFDTFSEEDFDDTVKVNFKGVFFGIQKALPFLNDGASIIITSSTVSELGIAGMVAYTASKAVELSLVKGIAAELAPRKIRVNALSPGVVSTPIYNRKGETAQESEGVIDYIAGLNPLKRAGKMEEMAKGFLFLASDDSSYVNATELLIDGGFRNIK